MVRQVEKYLHPDTEQEKNRVAESGDFDEEMIERVFEQFYGNSTIFSYLLFSKVLNGFSQFSFLSDDASDYLLKWTEELATFKDFDWVVLRKFPEWSAVKKSMQILSAKASFDMAANSSAVFEQYGYMKKYCTAEKLTEWRTNGLATEDRWVEIFKYMEAEHVPFDQFSHIIEFILCFPGSSAPVERVFAKAKKVWKQESSSLQITTLNSILHVKINMDWNCMNFYKFLKEEPELLRKISSQDKYNFKQTEPENSPGEVSIDIRDTDSEDEDEE